MKIVILDGHAINPGDLSWDALQDLGSLEVFDRSAEDLILPRASKAEVHEEEKRVKRLEKQLEYWKRAEDIRNYATAVEALAISR